MRDIMPFLKLNNGMVITTAEAEDIEGIKLLWKNVFGDSDEYISLFIECRFEPSQCVVARSGSFVAAMLFMLPFTLRQPDVRYSGRYIYAVATHPDFRSRGISTALLDFAHSKAQNEGAQLAALVPASRSLFDYYRLRGFETEFYKCETQLHPDADSGCRLTVGQLQDLISLRRKSFENCSSFVDWDERALYHQQRENELLGGETLCFSEPQDGYALCLADDDGVFIREYSGDRIYPEVISAIAARYDKKTVKVRLPADRSQYDAVPFAMTKWYISERKAQRGTPAMISLVLD